MRPIPLTSEIEAIARKVIWFESPRQAVADPVRFLAYAMTYGEISDMTTIRRYVDDEELADALLKSPPGIFDARSWAYWNLVTGRYPAPPMPERSFDRAE